MSLGRSAVASRVTRRWGARRTRARDLVWQAEVTQDAADDGRLLDERDEPEPPAAPRTGQHVEPEGPLHQRGPLSPAPAIGALGSSRRAKPLVLDARRCTIVRVGSRPVDHLRAPAGTRAEHVVMEQMSQIEGASM